MARRVFLHVGAPKTGTTYLQELMHRNKGALEAVGVRYAEGAHRNDRVWASEVLREFSGKGRPPVAAGAWERILGQVREWDGTAVVSHEFLGACSRKQAARAHADLAPAEVHVLVTARDYAKQAAAVWQERLKYGYDVPFAEFTLDNETPAWSWRTQDLAKILARWRHDLPADRVHLVTVPSGGPPGELWGRFASVIGAESADIEGIPSANTSLGLVEAELLRRLDGRLRERGLLDGPQDRTRFVRDLLANRVLSQGSRERFTVTPAQMDDLVRRAQACAAAVQEAGYHVVGSLDDLVPDPSTAGGRTPDDARPDELLDAALDAIGSLLEEVKGERERRAATRPRRPSAGDRPPWRRQAGRLARAVRHRLR